MAEKTIANGKTNTPATQESTRSEPRFVAPPVDIYEEENRLVVTADVPGATKDTLHLNVENGVLTIQASVDHPEMGESVYQEFELVNYYRQFELSEAVDVEKISAEIKNGVLTLYLPKAEEAKPRQIQIKVA